MGQSLSPTSSAAFNQVCHQILLAADAFGQYPPGVNNIKDIDPEVIRQASGCVGRARCPDGSLHVARYLEAYIDACQQYGAAQKLATTPGWALHDAFCSLQDELVNAPVLSLEEHSVVVGQVEGLKRQMDAIVQPHLRAMKSGGDDSFCVEGVFLYQWESEIEARDYITMIRSVMETRTRFLYVPFTRLYRVVTSSPALAVFSATTVSPVSLATMNASKSELLPAVLNNFSRDYCTGFSSLRLSHSFLAVDARFMMCDDVSDAPGRPERMPDPSADVIAAAASYLDGFAGHGVPNHWQQLIKARYPLGCRHWYAVSCQCRKVGTRRVLRTEVLYRAIKRAALLILDTRRGGDDGSAVVNDFVRSLLCSFSLGDASTTSTSPAWAWHQVVVPVLSIHYSVDLVEAFLADSLGHVSSAWTVVQQFLTRIEREVLRPVDVCPAACTAPRAIVPRALRLALLKAALSDVPTKPLPGTARAFKRLLGCTLLATPPTAANGVTQLQELIQKETASTSQQFSVATDSLLYLVHNPKFVDPEKVKTVNLQLRNLVTALPKRTNTPHDRAYALLLATALAADAKHGGLADVKNLEAALNKDSRLFPASMAFRLWLAVLRGYIRQARHDKQSTVKLDERVLQLCEVSLGPRGHTTALAQLRLASSYQSAKQPLPVVRKLLLASARTLGDGDADVVLHAMGSASSSSSFLGLQEYYNTHVWVARHQLAAMHVTQAKQPKSEGQSFSAWRALTLRHCGAAQTILEETVRFMRSLPRECHDADGVVTSIVIPAQLKDVLVEGLTMYCTVCGQRQRWGPCEDVLRLLVSITTKQYRSNNTSVAGSASAVPSDDGSGSTAGEGSVVTPPAVVILPNKFESQIDVVRARQRARVLLWVQSTLYAKIVRRRRQKELSGRTLLRAIEEDETSRRDALLETLHTHIIFEVRKFVIATITTASSSPPAAGVETVHLVDALLLSLPSSSPLATIRSHVTEAGCQNGLSDLSLHSPAAVLLSGTIQRMLRARLSELVVVSSLNSSKIIS
eukprot:PhM_4_TR1750/c0_g1_i1/m.98426